MNYYNLTNPQKSIWLTEKFYQGTSINTICGYFSFNTKVDFTILKKAINEMVKTNDAMRLKVTQKEGNCLQYLEEYSPFDIDTIELSSEKEVKETALKFANTPFFSENDFLFKVLLFKLPNCSGGFFMNVHHLIGDSWSLGLIAKDVARIYSELLSNNYKSQLQPSYINYINAENDYKNSDKYVKDKAYWDDVFKTIPEIASISSTSDEKKSKTSCKGARKEFVINENNLNNIKAFCDKYRISIYNFFMAVYAVYISKFSGLDDFVIGTPVLNRTNFEQKHTMGMFISVAPLRINLNPENSFIDFAKKVAIDTTSIFRHQKYSYQTILEDIRKRDSSIPSLYNVILSYQITKAVEKDNNLNYTTDWLFNGNAGDELEIHLFDLNDENKMTIAYDYKQDKLTELEINNLHDKILSVIDQIISNNNTLLKNLEIITPEEKHKILYDFNNTFVDYPRDKTIVDLFEDQVQKTPDNIAVIFEDTSLTYKELNKKANQLAHILIKNNVKIGDIVGIYLNKSLEVVVSMFAILKSGATFLPLDLDYPEDRLNYIINNSSPKVILSSKNVSCNIDVPTILVDLSEDFYNTEDASNLNISITPEDLMYVMYTSGSTGNPKGVMVKHKNIIRLAAFPNFIEFSKDEVMVQTGTIVFDACIFEIFGSLLHGFKLYILKKENILDIPYLTNFLKEKNVTILFLTTGLFNQLGIQNPSMFSNLKYLLTGGDVISKASIGKIKACTPNLKIINCYGPTENGSYSTCYQVIGNEKIIPIGKPITNSTAYVVTNGTLCPIGVPGELWVGGDGVARGYLNNENLTKEQFVSNPFGDGIIYKTGDLVKWLPDGNIAFLGRIDNQVKVRGFRIELSEIDRKLLDINNIKQALTVIKNINNNKTICSYVLSDEQIDIKKLKSILEKHLPSYMVPTFIMQLKEFPLNINGKVDIKALPIPSIDDIKREIVNPRNDIDKIIVELLEELLNIKNISITDSFFDLGGDSLSAISFTNTISHKLNVTVTVGNIFNHPVIKDLSDYIASLAKLDSRSISKAAKKPYYPASNAQKRIYYASIMDDNSVLYNVSGGIILDKPLDIELLEKCFNKLIDRHEVLRTHFKVIENDIVQIIDDKIDFNLKLEKANSDNLNDIYNNFIKPFDLSKAPLFRCKIAKLKNGQILLLLDMHHIISDGTSLTILLNELCTLYNGETLPEKHIDYKDFTLWEKDQFNKEKFKKTRDFWVNQYKDEIPLLNMPTTYARPSVQSFEGANYYINLNNDIFESINNLAKKLEITPYMLMLSVFYILISKYTSQNDIVIGTPIVGRELPELSNILGMFVNTLALKNNVDHALSFKDFSANIKNYCLSAFQNQTYPFDELVKELNLKRDTSRNPLFDIMFIYQNNGYPEINFKGIKSKYFIPDSHISKFDLSLEIIPINDELSLRFEYCTKLFDEDFIKRFSLHYINILNAILENSNIKIADIDMLSEREKKQILCKFNDTTMDYPRNKTIVDLFEKQVEKTPDNIAVVFEDKQLTYQELNEKANQLARYLIEKGVKNGSIVGIVLPRSLEIIISMFAILKTGAAYLPLDPTYPKNRINYITNDSKVNLILSNDDSITINNVDIVDITLSKNSIYNKYDVSNLNEVISPDNLAYVIYTSGSTGNPKGVAITHKNVNNFIKGTMAEIKFDKVIVSVTTICFDIFVLESILPLENGLTIIMANETEQTIPEALNKLCLKNKVTMLQTTPSKFSLLISDEGSLDFLKELKVIMLGGEAFPYNLLQKIKSLTNAKIYNMYGPTETTVWSSIKDLSNTNDITIGKPIANTIMYILDDNLNLLPVNIPGKLYIGGDGVCKGYLNNHDLTNARFVANPYDNSKKIYDTGDLAKWSSNGELIYLGRSDFQVKIRGLRIELGEIEKIFLTFNGIENVKVTANTDSFGRQILCAYFVSKNRIPVAELKQYLSMFLPNYMLPTYIMQIDDFKYTPNGKIDVKSLPEPNFTNTNKNIILPKSDTECEIAKIWEDLLCISPISVTDNFFEIGGDSLLALKMQIALLKENINVTYAEIFKYSTIRKLATFIDKKIIASENSLDFYKSYDYSNVNNVLVKNNVKNLKEIFYHPMENVLLTGVTGFLGAHILNYLIQNTDIKIYCLVRKDPSTSLTDKVLRKLHFYFGDKYDNLINKRIFIINSDLTQDKLGLSDEKLLSLSDKISYVINTAATVKHYGNYSDFEAINTTSVKKLIDFCERYNKKLIQISTISVSGNTLADFATNDNNFENDVNFNETNLYIGQSMENVYVRSKFEAEKSILEEIAKNKLEALILRIGNITSRFSDGKFQLNSKENAFANKIKSFLEISALPNYVLDKYIEFSPVDYVAEAVVKSIEYFNKNISVLHIYNPNHVFIKDFIDLLPKKNKINIVSDLEFRNIINNMLKNDEKKYIISNILNDLNSENKLVYDTPIKIESDFSQEFLTKIDFSWPIITKKYIENLIKNI